MGAATQAVTESCARTSHVCPSSQKLIQKADASTRLDTEAKNVHSPEHPLLDNVEGLVPATLYKVISVCRGYGVALVLLSLSYGAYLSAKLARSSRSIAAATGETEVLKSMKLMAAGSTITTVDAAIGFVAAIALSVIASCVGRQGY
ncbi:hypothetical protein FRB94_009636 [Tulasnella sp. JGI-2019a]|nr:hypothetical protein FRB94_009636 [Tulasnella sp. JGI-2019a]KAG9023661.1 hypothetical protein FRB95_012653 [Tulasnella sp. JGI-2019a]